MTGDPDAVAPTAKRRRIDEPSTTDSENPLASGNHADWDEIETLLNCSSQGSFKVPKDGVPVNRTPPLEQGDKENPKFERFRVEQVTPRDLEKHLLLGSEDGSQRIPLRLRGQWASTPIKEGDTVHLTSCDPQDTLIIPEYLDNDSSCLLILNPDTIVSVTLITNSLSCTRKPVLKSRLRAKSDYGPAVVYGCMAHTMLQDSLRDFDFKKGSRQENLIKQFREELWLARQSDGQARVKIQDIEVAIEDFGRQWTVSDLGVQNRLPRARYKGERSLVTGVIDIEESIWCPRYGIRGVIDAIVHCVPENIWAPLEIKSSSRVSSSAHRGQTVLYALMFSDRYDTRQTCMLTHLGARCTTLVEPSRAEIRGLIIRRNLLAYWLREDKTLPPLTDDPRSCQWCELSGACMTMHKCFGDGYVTEQPLQKIYRAATDHLCRESDGRFLKKWERLLRIEESGGRSAVKWWTKSSSSRERAGLGLGSLKLVRFRRQEGNLASAFVTDADLVGRLWQYFYTFSIPKANYATKLSVNEFIAVSTELGHYAIAHGIVTELETSSVTVRLSRKLLGNGMNQVFRQDDNLLFRIDKADPDLSLATARMNLFQLFSPDPNCRRLHKIVVEDQLPRFAEESKVRMPEIVQQHRLSDEQMRALKAAILTENYLCIRGMPGTGKTTTIAAIIETLVYMGKRVLMSAYTHTAVDNVLLKLKKRKIPFVRLAGKSEKIHLGLEGHTWRKHRYRTNTVDDVDTFYGAPVFGTTCLGVGDPVFSRVAEFDVCVVDEASQMTLPIALGPLLLAKKFILVGDDYQLQPLVQTELAKTEGLGTSLFESLCSLAEPCSLTLQWRMNAKIMSVANTAIYNGQLRCANDAVASRKLELGPAWRNRSSLFARIIDPKSPVVGLDTATINSGSPGVDLEEEANLVATIANEFHENGVREIGLLCAYRHQLRHLQRGSTQAMDVDTVDSYQGRDREVIVLWLAPPINERQAQHLRDWRRMNVAVTRAKTKLLVVTNIKMLQAWGAWEPHWATCFGIADMVELSWKPNFERKDSGFSNKAATSVPQRT